MTKGGGIVGRTREQWEQVVLDQVREHGGFSVFWATNNSCIAAAAGRLEERGDIVRVELGRFPWCPYLLRDQND